MGLVHQSDRGSQYLSIRYAKRLDEAGIEPSVGSVGDSYDKALAETINGLYMQKSFIVVALGAASKSSNTRHLNGWTVSTTAASSSPSETSRQPRRRSTSTQLCKVKTWPRN